LVRNKLVEVVVVIELQQEVVAMVVSMEHLLGSHDEQLNDQYFYQPHFQMLESVHLLILLKTKNLLDFLPSLE
jgi:hypothetical protein